MSLDIEGLLTALYGDLVMSAGTGQTGIEIDPSLWESDDVTSAFLTLNGPRAVLVLHTPAAIDGRCPRLSRAWFPDAEQWEWEPHTQTFARI